MPLSILEILFLRRQSKALENLILIGGMKIFQQQLQLKERKRGFHLITEEIAQALPQINEIQTGLCQVFIQHT